MQDLFGRLNARVLFAVSLFVLVTSTAFGSVQHRVDGAVFGPLDRSDRAVRGIEIKGIPLADGKLETLVLEEFDVLAPGAVIRVTQPDGKVVDAAPTPMRQYRGIVAGDPSSVVYVSRVNGNLAGLIVKDERQYGVTSRTRPHARRVHSDAAPADELSDVFVEEFGGDLSGNGYECAIDGKIAQLRAPRAAQVDRMLTSQELPMESQAYAWSTSTSATVLNLAISTDSSMFTNFGAGATAATIETFARDLVGKASIIYKRDLRTELRIVFLEVKTTSDPWSVNAFPGGGVNDTGSALEEYRDYWVNTPPANVSKAAGVLLSGAYQGTTSSWSTGGIAWVDALFESSWAFAFCGGIGINTVDRTVPNPDANTGYVAPSSGYWALLQFAHELGHVVQSVHTHCIKYDGANYIDNCYSGEGGCYSGVTGVPPQNGTIMSYCHLAGGGTATRFTFGQPSEPSALILTNMRGRIDSYTPALSAITTPGTVTIGNAATASVTNTGLTYSWSITNGTFSGGGSSASGASVTFTASATPVTLTVTATDATGHAITDSKSVTANPASCTAPVVTTSPTSRTITSGASTTLSVTATGTATLSYQWYIGASGVTTSPVGGATSSSVAVSPVSSTTYWVRVTNSCGSADSAAAVVTVNSPQASVRGDFNGDGKADILWRNYATGQNFLWSMNGATYLAGITVSPSAETAWRMCGVGDFNLDGSPDIVWRNQTSGQNVVWFMKAGAIPAYISPGFIMSVGGPWTIVAVADFNSDGKPDLLWRNPTTGEVVVWFLNGTTWVSSAVLYSAPEPWRIEGAADMTGDGKTDIVWRNYGTGDNLLWQMNGTAYVAPVWLPGVGDTNWNLEALADYNGDGKTDLVWRNTSTGENRMWLMNNTTLSSSLPIYGVGDLNWQIAGPR